ncbi:MAG TPA: hypothetical protein DHN29_21995 [Cytophagales bacterium]|jgi:hypothetical protein|nr:hypothetical protein [Cytophagales bacterium]|tara:strand:- start:413 stop:703 length:291 start_codon:yes stop_codon:yes gene_type:complete
MIEVHHVRNPTFGFGDPPLWPEDYIHVASVDIDDTDMGLVFQLTNTIDHYWWDNPGITARFEGDGCRSTSVGDVMITSSNRVLRCAGIGWEEVESF